MIPVGHLHRHIGPHQLGAGQMSGGNRRLRQRAAVGLLEAAGLCADGTGESTPLVAEELRLE
jgi:uncharacterized Ntn-hydrolase superfamily protein